MILYTRPFGGGVPEERPEQVFLERNGRFLSGVKTGEGLQLTRLESTWPLPTISGRTGSPAPFCRPFSTLKVSTRPGGCSGHGNRRESPAASSVLPASFT